MLTGIFLQAATMGMKLGASTPILATMALLLGCRLSGNEGPIPASLMNSRQLSRQGIAAIEQDDWSRAEALLAEAVEVCPDDAEARRYYAEALWRRNRQLEAVAELDVAARLADDDPTIPILAARMRLALGQWSEASKYAQQAVDLDPHSAEAWAVRARVKQAQGHPREALADYHRALGLAPEDRVSLLAVAELYRQRNQPQLALATLHHLADSYPRGQEPQRVLHLQGLAYSHLGRREDAVDSLRVALAHGSPTPDLLHDLAEAELTAGHPAAAAEAAVDALALNPSHRRSHLLLNRANVALGRASTLRK